jgi:anti-anti-sigma regulatory factor
MFIDGSIFEATTSLQALAKINASRTHMQKLGDTFVFQWSRSAAADEAELIAAMRSESPAGGMVLDLAQFESIDPSRLGTLVTAAREAARNAIRLKLMNVRPGVEAFLRDNNLLAVFEMCSPHEVLTLWCRAARCSRPAFPAP